MLIDCIQRSPHTWVYNKQEHVWIYGNCFLFTREFVENTLDFLIELTIKEVIDARDNP